MNMLNNLLFSNPALMNIWMFLTDAGTGTGGIGTKHSGLNTLFKWALWAGGAAITLVMVFSIVKSAKEYALGSGSGGIGKILGKVIFLVFCLGIIALAASWETIANKGSNLAESGLDIVQNVADTVGKGMTDGN